MSKAFWIAGLMLAAVPALLPGQAFVEYGLATAASAGAGAPGQGASRAIGGVFSNLTKTLDAAKETTAAPAPSPVPVQPGIIAAAPAKPEANPKPAITYEDPAGIRKDMDRAELLRRFGEPSMRITTGPGCEAFTYEGKTGRFEVELRDSKVASVQAKTKPLQTAVVLLQ